MLKYASSSDQYKDVLLNTKGIVFFATPHFGSSLVTYSDITGIDLMFRGTKAIEELKPQNTYLALLNEEFPKYAPHV